MLYRSKWNGEMKCVPVGGRWVFRKVAKKIRLWDGQSRKQKTDPPFSVF
jgi:hypothetical protein